MKIDSALVGAAGEHLVLSRLLSRGFITAQAPRRARQVDILVNSLTGDEPCLIQGNPAPRLPTFTRYKSLDE